jgi:DNA polymerase-3 subunit chi
MASVEFHSGVDDPLRFACRLLRKACGAGARLVVTAAPSTLQALDRELWVFDAHAFVPHVRVRAGQQTDATLLRTPVWLCEGSAPEPCPKLLVNLGAEAPQRLDLFDRVIEIVPTDPQERQRARTRWRDYEAHGLAITHHAHAASA